jgi:hypothetical protein
MVWIWVAGIWVTLGLGVTSVVARAIRLANQRRAAAPWTERNVVADLGPVPDPDLAAPRAIRREPAADEASVVPIRSATTSGP